MKKSAPIVNLHVHSHLSTLDGMGTPIELMAKAAKLNQPAVAITDHGNMNNFGYFHNAAKSSKVKPIYGCEYYQLGSLSKWMDKHTEYKDSDLPREEKQKLATKLRKRFHLVLLVKNKVGFANMNELMYQSYLNMYYRPRIDHSLLVKYHEGLICSSACLMGQVQDQIRRGKTKAAIKTAAFFKDLFGEDYYLELQFNELDDQHVVNDGMVKIARDLDVKLIITGDSHYIERQHATTHQTLLLLQTKKSYADLKNKKVGAWEFTTKELFFKDREDYWTAAQKWKYRIGRKEFDRYMDNTVEIASKVEEIEFDTSMKLKDINPGIKDKRGYLHKQCVKRLRSLGLADKPTYVDRLDYEVDVIDKKSFTNYFLAIAKIVADARKKMFIGCGRGSGAGSLVNYLLGITRVDPIKHKLYFERFLSINRADYPDIDIDFENNDEIKEDLIKEYPKDVACITSYSLFQISGLLKDLARVYNIDSSQHIDKLNKAIRVELKENLVRSEDEMEGKDIFSGATFEEAMKFSPSFRGFMKANKSAASDMQVLLGQVRNLGRHAAGVVICDELVKRQPTIIVKDVLQTSLSEGTRDKSLTDFGFVKIDILGLRTLKVIHSTVDLIAKKKEMKASKVYNRIRADRIDLEDPRVYKKIFEKLNLVGVFQFETDSIRPMIQQTKPTCFEDLSAINALYRPGPLQGGFAFEYGERKRGETRYHFYKNNIVKRVLKSTYGIIIYQEQVMELGHFLGKLSLAETNVMRKLIVKANKVEGKVKTQLDKMKKKFIKGAVENKLSKENALELWVMMEKFSGYGFNRSHAISYAIIAYQCSYLKTYHPAEFYVSLLNNEPADNYSRILKEMNDNGIKVEQVDLNKSDRGFLYIEKKVYWGLSRLIGIGDKAATTIIATRDRRPVKGLKDFLLRSDVDWRVCNKRVVDILIKTGAFDVGGIDRRKFALEIYHAVSGNRKYGKASLVEKNAIIDEEAKRIKKELKGELSMTDVENSVAEKDAYRVNIMHSPFSIGDRPKKISGLRKNARAGKFVDAFDYAIVEFKDIVRFNDKRGGKMARFKACDEDGVSKDSLIFSSHYKEEKVKEGVIYCIRGDQEQTLLIKEYKDIDKIKMAKK